MPSKTHRVPRTGVAKHQTFPMAYIKAGKEVQ